MNSNRTGKLARVPVLAMFVLALFAAATTLHAQQCGGTFTSIDYPGATQTRAHGINSSGDIVGLYTDASGTHGYLLRGGQFASIDVPGSGSSKPSASDAVNSPDFTVIDFPGALSTQAWGINDAGDIVGYYTVEGPVIHAFLLRDGEFTSVEFPGHINTLGIKSTVDGTVVGCFHDMDAMDSMHGYVWSEENGYSSFALPFSMHNGITPGGDIVGLYGDGDNRHGYLVSSNGEFTQIDFPGAAQTRAWDINPQREIVGGYLDDANASHGFLLTTDGFCSIDFPEAETFTFGINPAGDIVGFYTDSEGRNHGYLLSRGEKGGSPSER